jgi:hypothetical protein
MKVNNSLNHNSKFHLSLKMRIIISKNNNNKMNNKVVFNLLVKNFNCSYLKNYLNKNVMTLLINYNCLPLKISVYGQNVY